MTDHLSRKLRRFVDQNSITPDPNFKVYSSGVYAVIDCVFSAQAHYTTVQDALERLEAHLPDTTDLSFSTFLADLQQTGITDYTNILTKQQLSQRLKIEICRDIAGFFVRHKIETLADFQSLTPDEAERLVLTDLESEIQGIGPTLALYLLILMGNETHVKPDTLLTRLMLDITGEPGLTPEQMREAISSVATELETTPARLENALWKFESIGRQPLPWNEGGPQSGHNE